MTDWSPERPCPICGAGVQTYSGPRRSYPTTFVAGTWQRHYHHEPRPEKQIRECDLCHEHYSATLESERPVRWSEHGCPQVARYEPRSIPTTAIVAEIADSEPESDSTPVAAVAVPAGRTVSVVPIPRQMPGFTD
jgi:hypothetical protein